MPKYLSPTVCRLNINIWKSYMWTADETWVKFDPRSVLSTSAVEKATWKKFRLERDSNPWPCDTGAMLYPLSYQATWIDSQLWVRDIPDDSETYEYKYKYISCLIRSSHIWFSYIYIYMFHYHRVYHELTIDYLFMWLGSSVDRALHRYRKVMGSNPVQAWIFFRLLFQLLKLIAHCEDQISLKFADCWCSHTPTRVW